MTSSRLAAATIAAWFIASAAPALAAPCRISAKAASIDKVTVSPQGADSFTLKLDKVPMVVVPSRTGTATLHVKSPLRFTVANQPMKTVAVRTSKKAVLLGGRLTLAPGLAPKVLGTKSATLLVMPPLPGFSLRHKTLGIPCRLLTVASDNKSSSTPSVAIPTGRTEHALPTDYIPLYRTTKRVAPVWIKFSVPLMVIARKGQWVKLQIKWLDGSSLQGWVPNSLVEIRLDEPPSAGDGVGVGGIGGMCGTSHRPSLVNFTIARNAPIHASAGGPVWAHTAKTVKVKAFMLSRSDGWVRIAKIDKLPAKPCSYHDTMWVHARHLVWAKHPK